jgi:hypothetical protein
MNINGDWPGSNAIVPSMVVIKMTNINTTSRIIELARMNQW